MLEPFIQGVERQETESGVFKFERICDCTDPENVVFESLDVRNELAGGGGISEQCAHHVTGIYVIAVQD